ncbi:MAG: hypothetical protein AAF500_21655 [Myxococcota bacterium]
MYNSLTKHLALCALGLVVACADAPETRLGVDVSELEFVYFDSEEGVHPSIVVLDNPNNPFRDTGVDGDAKFAITGGVGEDRPVPASNAAQFYAWATALASEATGVNQLFAAQSLRNAYEAGEINPDDEGRVRELVIAGFQSVLDNFSETLLFDEDGNEQPVNGATAALTALFEMNADVEGGWVLVEVPDPIDPEADPGVVAMRTSDIPREERR